MCPSVSFCILFRFQELLTQSHRTGNKSWFINTGVAEEQIKEMDWWDDCELCPEELGYPLKEGELSVEDEEPTASRLRFTCVPAQHNSGQFRRSLSAAL